MRSPLAHAPCGITPRDDPEGWHAFLLAWHDRFGDGVVDAVQLVHVFNLASTRFDALAYTPRRCRVILNRLLYDARGRAYEPFMIEPVGATRDGTTAYRLRLLAPLTHQEADHRG